jgi:hypothetical protein
LCPSSGASYCCTCSLWSPCGVGSVVLQPCTVVTAAFAAIKISHSKKDSARYCYKFTLIFMDPCIVDDSVEIPTRCSFVIECIIPNFIEGLNMFRAVHRSSSGVLKCICSLWFIHPCGDRSLPRLSGNLVASSSPVLLLLLLQQ